MHSIIKEIYLSTINKNTVFEINNGEYLKIMESLRNIETLFFSSLNDSNKFWFQEFSNKHMELNCITATENFSNGFKIGALLMTEIYSESMNKLNV